MIVLPLLRHHGDDIEFVYDHLRELLINSEQGKHVDTGHWQAIKDVPHTKTIELQDVVIETPIAPTPGSLASFWHPNLPWAEDHFKERVAGEPTNPGEEYKNWPWYKGGVEDHKETGQFSHTYQERFWPRHANYLEPPEGIAVYSENMGVRYRLGDLNDLVNLLEREPYTRQAFLPVWFPEDTGAHHGERVPCTLGYHFMLRDDRLSCFYPLRSCDFVRYFRDDAYQAGRLTQWVLDQLHERGATMSDEPFPAQKWMGVDPGNLIMHIRSLHCFEGDEPKLRREHGLNRQAS